MPSGYRTLCICQFHLHNSLYDDQSILPFLFEKMEAQEGLSNWQNFISNSSGPGTN